MSSVSALVEQPVALAPVLSVRILKRKAEIDETLPLIESLHAESRYGKHPIDPERRRRFMVERVLGDPNRYGMFVARHGDRPVGIMTCLADNHLYTDVVTVSCLSFHVLKDCRRTLLGGRIAIKLIHAGRKWAMYRRAIEINVHVTTGIDIVQSDRFLRRVGFRQTGGNYTLPLPREVP